MTENKHPFKEWAKRNKTRTKDLIHNFKFGYAQLIRILTYNANPALEAVDKMAQLMSGEAEGYKFNNALAEITLAHRKGQISSDLMSEV